MSWGGPLPPKDVGIQQSRGFAWSEPFSLTVLPSMEGRCELFTCLVHSGTALAWQGGQDALVCIRCLLTHAKPFA